ncbi:MAG: 50S ribosomal protein L18 [Parcubacteria group bacterium]|nr:50S ribosomal protein L18 [Parcubacteria group bacterium]
MVDAKTKRIKRVLRHKRVRAKVMGTGRRPRLCVFRSNRHIYAQVIDDAAGRTLAELNSLNLAKSLKGAKKISGLTLAGEVGAALGEKVLKLGYKEVVFDKGGYKYHGQVKALADGVRRVGVSF